MPYRSYSKSLREHEAIEYHKKEYGKHTFYISSVEEYERMLPFMKALRYTRVDIISSGTLTIEEIKREYRLNYHREYDKKRPKKILNNTDESDEVWSNGSVYSLKYKKGITANYTKVNSKVANRDLRKAELVYGRKI